MGSPNYAARLVKVSKAYGPTRALDQLNLTLDRGEILALLGPNGAGKTTAVSVLTGTRRADSGSVELLGGSPRNLAIRRRIGLTPQESGFPNALRVGEILRLVRAHYPAPLADPVLFDRFPLQPLLRRQAGGLSGGQKRMLAVALAFAGAPELVFLDEPTTGLDVDARRALWRAIGAYRDDGGTIVLTTHYLEEAEALATRVVVIHGGRAVAAGSVDEIRGRVGQSRVRFDGEAPDNLPSATRIERSDGRVTIYTQDADALVRAMVQRGVAFANLEVQPASLEEAFVEITGGGTQ
ncbi:MAG: ABC transporter ATP-binding protein [Proteobacteria bacterium]|nr:ABC transporter ATP-binding protein [Pseudomonadota bacterium]MDA1059159.1 ABC transporter ATP-binding protein [Pseudomonadota bacterium]